MTTPLSPEPSPPERPRLGRALTSVFVAVALWPLGLLGAFFLFFGDAADRTHDPRDAVIPYFLAFMLAGALAALGVGGPAWKRRPWVCAGAALLAAPWLVLSGWGLLSRAMH